MNNYQRIEQLETENETLKARIQKLESILHNIMNRPIAQPTDLAFDKEWCVGYDASTIVAAHLAALAFEQKE